MEKNKEPEPSWAEPTRRHRPQRAPAPAAPTAAPTKDQTYEKYGVQGWTVLVNVPSYNTGNDNVVTKVAALVVVDLGDKHLVITQDLNGGEMLFQIQEDRGDLKKKKAPNSVVLPKQACVNRLQTFLSKKVDVEVCKVRTPYMNNIAKFGTPAFNMNGTTLQIHGAHQAIRLYDANDEGDNPVFLAVYLDKHVEQVSLVKKKIETRFLIQKSDYCAYGAPDADLGPNINISSSCMDVVRAYSTVEWDPLSGTDGDGCNYQEWIVYHGKKKQKKKAIIQLKAAAATRLQKQIVDTLLALAQADPFERDDDNCATDELEAVDGGKVYEVLMAHGENGRVPRGQGVCVDEKTLRETPASDCRY